MNALFVDMDGFARDAVAGQKTERSSSTGHLRLVGPGGAADGACYRTPKNADAGATLWLFRFTFFRTGGRIAVDNSARDVGAQGACRRAPTRFPDKAACPG